MATAFEDASCEVIKIASELIQDHHTHLVNARIKYLFRTGKWTSLKRSKLGSAKKVGKELNYLTEYDFIITLNAAAWYAMSDETRRALLDHELEHCCHDIDKKGNDVWFIQGHDLEDFHSIIKRHGFWSGALRKVKQIIDQTTLNFGENSFDKKAPSTEKIPSISVNDSKQQSPTELQ